VGAPLEAGGQSGERPVVDAPVIGPAERGRVGVDPRRRPPRRPEVEDLAFTGEDEMLIPALQPVIQAAKRLAALPTGERRGLAPFHRLAASNSSGIAGHGSRPSTYASAPNGGGPKLPEDLSRQV